MLQVEGHDDGEGHDGHVGRQAQPGEKCALGGGVISGVGGVVVEEQRAGIGATEEDFVLQVVGSTSGGMIRVVSWSIG